MTRGVWILCKKELKESFSGPLIYVLSALFCCLMGWLFFNYLVASGHRDLTTVSLTNSVLVPTFGNMNFIFLFLAPLLTMRLLSEEKKMHTMEFLFLSQLTTLEIIIGKFLASFLMAAFMLSSTLLFPIVLAMSGYSDWGTVLTSYSGILLSMMAYLSVGLFASSLTENQIVAAVISFCLLLGLMLLVITSQATHNLIVAEIFQYMSTPYHFESFVRGSVRSFNLVYFISFISFFFYATYLSLESRKW
jgi:ABC-2 type transport system permease protein